MDDDRFDDIIKSKVGEYREAGFDPSALAALHHHMDSAAGWPWYSRYRTELLMASGFLLTTVIILWTQWWFASRETVIMGKTTLQLQSQQEQIAKLQSEVNLLKGSADTIRIIEVKEKSNPVNALLLQKIAELEHTILMSKESQTGVTATDQGAFTAPTEFSTEYSYGYSYQKPFSLRVSPRQKDRATVQIKPKSHTLASREGVMLPAKILRDLEKHYRNGIGIRIGPTVDFSHGLYDRGRGRVDLAAGILGDFIVSPSLSIETGGKLIHRFNEVSGQDINKEELPFSNPALGPLSAADVDSWILEIPATLKYRYPLSDKKCWIGGLGYSLLIFTKQVFEYDHELDGNPSARINEAHTVGQAKVYPGVLNVSLGLSHQLKNKKILETSFYYQQGLGEIGYEKMKASFIGVRSAYWFRLK